MLILIAESKTMSQCGATVNCDDFKCHHPMFESRAADIMGGLRNFDLAELVAATKLSPAMSTRLRDMAYSFADKSEGCEAIEAFTGVVFKAFSYPTLPPGAKTRASERVRIISSLYGWLRPDDIIKAYRLDFGMRVSPDGDTLSGYWRDAVSESLLRFLSDKGCRSILNLLPADAAKCIDWKRVAAVATVFSADFKSIKDGEKIVTPHAGRLKTLRGQLLRRIIEDDISAPEDLCRLSTDNFVAGSTGDDGNIVFFVD